MLKIFVAQQEKEERVFLADTVFLDNIIEMMDENAALLFSEHTVNLTLPLSHEKKVTITEYGLEVLTGKKTLD